MLTLVIMVVWREHEMSYLYTRSKWIDQRVTIFICLLTTWLSSSVAAQDVDISEPSVKSPVRRFASLEILIKFKNGVSRERIAFILKNNQFTVIAEIQRGYLYHVRVPDNRSVESAITQLTSYQEIEYVEPNYRYETKK